MSFIINLCLLFIMLIAAIIIGVVKKNKLILTISCISAVLIIVFLLFLIFVLIPSM